MPSLYANHLTQGKKQHANEGDEAYIEGYMAKRTKYNPRGMYQHSCFVYSINVAQCRFYVINTISTLRFNIRSLTLFAGEFAQDAGQLYILVAFMQRFCSPHSSDSLTRRPRRLLEEMPCSCHSSHILQLIHILLALHTSLNHLLICIFIF